jgi:hypothetical protein
VHSPAYDPNLVVRPPREDWEPYYGYYGFSPYWGGGYLYPHFPMSRKEPSELHRSRGITAIEAELRECSTVPKMRGACRPG